MKNKRPTQLKINKNSNGFSQRKENSPMKDKSPKRQEVQINMMAV